MPTIVRENDYGYGGNYYNNCPKGNEVLPNIREPKTENTLPKITSKLRLSARDKSILRDAKEIKNLTNKDIALGTGLNVTTVCKATSFNTQSVDCTYFTIKNIKKLAKYLGVQDKLQCLQ